MPGFNGTGPGGMGPMTGRSQGYCNPSRTTYGTSTAWGPGYWGTGYTQGLSRIRSPVFGRGFGRGFWSGLGRRRGFRRGPGRRWA
jgi:hypothetical protein